jgi:hypothetical protein
LEFDGNIVPVISKSSKSTDCDDDTFNPNNLPNIVFAGIVSKNTSFT